MKPIFYAFLIFSVEFLAGCSDDPSLVEENQVLMEDEQSSAESASSADGGVDVSSSSLLESLSSGKVSSSSSEQRCDASWVGNSTVIINEIMPGNISWNDDLGKDPGWIELYNTSDKTVKLGSYALVEKQDRSRKWVIENDEIPAKGFRIIFASKRDIKTPIAGVDSDSAHYRLHTNWKLEDNGGSVYLVNSDCGILDSANYPALDAGISYGKTTSGWRYFSNSTPEADNATSQGYVGFVSLPVFAENAGFYSKSVVVTPPQVSDGSTVRCTFDGSIPTMSTEVMTTAKTLTSNTVVRCAAFKDGLITNKVVTNTYFIDEEIKNMPVISVSVDSEFFKNHYTYVMAGSTSGLNPNSVDPNKTGLYADVEFPVHVEYFANGSASESKAWEIDAGISLMGGYSRLEKKKSVAISMREEYQDGWLKYPLFETRKETNSKFKGFNLRNNGNRFVSDYVEDAMGGALMEGSGVDYQRSHQVVVFYDGKYWGIHDMRERFNKNYVETNYGIDAAEVTFIKHLNQTIEASNGTTVEYETLLRYVYENDFSGENNKAYETVKAVMDVENFATYMAAEMYMHNGDWPNNNVRAWKSPSTKWKFMIYDLDHGFDWEWFVAGFSQSMNMFDWVNQGGYSGGNCHSKASEKCFHTFFVKLIKNPEFKRMFINRSAILFKENVNSAKVASTLSMMTATLDEDQVSRDMDYFKQDLRGYYNSCGKGFSVSGSCMKVWAEDRDETIRQEYREEFGLSDDIEVSIASTSAKGYVTLDGIVLPNKSNYTGNFFGGNQMLLTAVPVSGKFVSWEDGSTNNPRLVTPASGVSYIATFK